MQNLKIRIIKSKDISNSTRSILNSHTIAFVHSLYKSYIVNKMEKPFYTNNKLDIKTEEDLFDLREKKVLHKFIYNFKTRKPMIVNVRSELTSELTPESIYIYSDFNDKDFTDIRTYSIFVNELHLGIDLDLMWVHSEMGRKRTERCEELLEEYGEYHQVFGLNLPVLYRLNQKA